MFTHSLIGVPWEIKFTRSRTSNFPLVELSMILSWCNLSYHSNAKQVIMTLPLDRNNLTDKVVN